MNSRSISIVTVFLFITSMLHSQNLGINSISIIPPSPVAADNIQVEAGTTHPSSPCQLQGSTVSVTGDSVIVTATYTAGMMPAICSSTDKITIGTLSPGNYVLKYSMQYPSGGILDTDISSFTVQGSNPAVFKIDSLKILPPAPSTGDSVMVAGFNSLAGNACHMTDSSVTISGSSINIDVFHVYDSASSVTCHSADTLQLGKLSKGNYSVKYRLRDSAGTTVLDSISRSFDVDGPLSNASLDSLKILPGVVYNYKDSMQAISYTSFPYSNCYLTDSVIKISNDSIKVNAFFHAGNQVTTCYSVDTFDIGQLPVGQYELIYLLRDSITSDTLDTMTKQVSVAINAIPESKKDYGAPEIYPNPAVNSIDLDLSSLPLGEYALRFYSINGLMVKQVTTSRETLSLDIKGLSDGVYLLFIMNETGEQWVEKITKASN